MSLIKQSLKNKHPLQVVKKDLLEALMKQESPEFMEFLIERAGGGVTSSVS